MWRNQKQSLIDFVLPASLAGEPVQFAVPHAYIQVISALVYFGTKSKDTHFEDVPTLALQLDYRDIGGKKHRAIFEIAVEIAVISDGVLLDGSFVATKVQTTRKSAA